MSGAGRIPGSRGSVWPSGLDINPAYIAAYRNPVLPGVVASAVQLPFRDHSFAGAWSIGLLHHLDDAHARTIVSEAMRVTRPGGYVAILDAVTPHAGQRPLAAMIRRWDRGRHIRSEPDFLALLPERRPGRASDLPLQRPVWKWSRAYAPRTASDPGRRSHSPCDNPLGVDLVGDWTNRFETECDDAVSGRPATSGERSCSEWGAPGRENSVQHLACLVPEAFRSRIRILCEEGHSVHLVFHSDKVDIRKATKQLLAARPDVTIGTAPRRTDKWTGFAFRTRTLRNYLMYFDKLYAGKDRLRAAAAAELSPRGSCAGRTAGRRYRASPRARPPALPGRTRNSQRPGHRRVRCAVAPDVLIVSPLVWFNSLQVDYIKTARKLGHSLALCVASWDNLTNKGQMREFPDRVTVWNAAQVEEAVGLHRYPRDRVVVTGAQTFDEWFEFRPSRSKEAFLAERGLAPDTALLLYLCSSTSIAPQEIDFVRQWQEAVREASGPARGARSHSGAAASQQRAAVGPARRARPDQFRRLAARFRAGSSSPNGSMTTSTACITPMRSSA